MALSLAYFIETAKARHLWRFIVKTAFKVPSKVERQELLRWARAEFDHNKHVTDPEKIRYLVSIGTKQVNDMAKTLNFPR